MAIGEIIKKARQAKRISSMQMAKSLNESPTLICKIEHNREIARKGLLLNICMLLDLDYNELKDKQEIIQPEINPNGSFVMGTKLVDGHRQHFNACLCGECGKVSEEYKVINFVKYICKACFKKLYPDYREITGMKG